VIRLSAGLKAGTAVYLAQKGKDILGQIIRRSRV
jgi:hypothetical protein